MWVHLRLLAEAGFHFRRQAPRDGYIVDFVCLKQRLIVEVDGGQHISICTQGATRSAIGVYQQGFGVLRFWNNEIDRNLEGVLTLIDEALQKPPPGLAARGHRPPSGGMNTALQPVKITTQGY